MTTEEIVNAVRDAGFSSSEMFLRLPAFKHLIESAAAAEREACAQLAAQTVCDTHLPTGIKIYGTAAAKAIRSRGNK